MPELDFSAKDAVYNKQRKVIQRAYQSKELRIFGETEIRLFRVRLSAPIFARLGGKGMRLEIMVTTLSAGFVRAIIAGMIPPQTPPKSSPRVLLFSCDSNNVSVGSADANS